MKVLRRLNLSTTLILLICFFLPWVQVSCGGAQDSVSGLGLARDGHALLWLIPVSILVLLLLEIVRAWTTMPRLYAAVNLVCGMVSAYLMNRERLRVNDQIGLISAQLTGWFWLGFLSSLVLAISSMILLVSGRASAKEEN
jgi:hypothetical protein